MALIRFQQDLSLPTLKETFYEGVVVDNNDPDKLQRVKIRIAELHGTENDIPDNHLPWAGCLRPTFLGGDTDLSISSVPRIGSKVTVQHMRGDIYQPMYCFEVADGSNIASQASQNYPNSYVLRDSDDNYWHVDMVDNKLDIKFNGNEFLEITANLDTTIGGNETKSIGGNETRTISGSRTTNVATSDTKTVPSFTINASSSVTINSPSVSVNSGTVTVSGGDVIADGISLKGHTHSHGDPAGITSPPL